ncbi:hypothetical protein [Natronorubrum daqingense]|uniref:Uncharacterized protein n=1 Tax=Natronorubrum daqingense TaxID=588898 RepID=A0A1N6YIY8_9EURY|nr:hypothetical protein [Natronorubrum daqingense]APX95653.1 hypothetical protein BB347_02945 [Natronorubrum daqingense]SIR14471.1 hypothetical protein SAMN05421809_0456 [Natronorubrum daqingense]
MMIPSRRRLLQVSGVSLVAAGAGCVSLQSLGSEETRLERLEVVNSDTTAYTIHVLMAENGDPAYFDSQELDARSDDGDEAGNVVFDGYPDETGSYTIYSWVDDQPPEEWSEFDTTERDACTEVTITVGGPDRTGDIVIRSTDGCPPDDETES